MTEITQAMKEKNDQRQSLTSEIQRMKKHAKSGGWTFDTMYFRVGMIGDIDLLICELGFTRPNKIEEVIDGTQD